MNPVSSPKLNNSQIQVLKNQKDYSEDSTINFSEKIIFVIDTVQEVNNTPFVANTDIKYSDTCMLKRVIEIFLHNKSMLNKKHEFALLVMKSETVDWLCDFMQNNKELLNILDGIQEDVMKEYQQYFNLSKVFNLVYKKLTDSYLLKNNIVRIIFVYCRSNSIPKFDIESDALQKLIHHSNFFLDILYIHESVSSENKCIEIYNKLMQLDTRKDSYIMELSKNALELHNCMGLLLAHPIQRVPQKFVKYNVNPSLINDLEEN